MSFKVRYLSRQRKWYIRISAHTRTNNSTCVCFCPSIAYSMHRKTRAIVYRLNHFTAGALWSIHMPRGFPFGIGTFVFKIILMLKCYYGMALIWFQTILWFKFSSFFFWNWMNVLRVNVYYLFPLFSIHFFHSLPLSTSLILFFFILVNCLFYSMYTTNNMY